MNEAIDAIEKNEMGRLKNFVDEGIVRARDTRGKWTPLTPFLLQKSPNNPIFKGLNGPNRSKIPSSGIISHLSWIIES